ncbi:unnamed protein product [Prorocentrum cordatum]|uniref:EF-hand domain-containing protein n=1 Tax=Prorocentrum cordatum TaxID=2364126 RepID=A0ABN9TBI6_9DINO|nr:unnamed protein product [Polarella glacialis]
MSGNRLSPEHADGRVQRSKLRFNTGPPREQSVDALLSPEALGRRPQKAATIDGGGGPRRSFLGLAEGSPASRRPSNSNTGMPPSPRKDVPRLSGLGSTPDLLGRRPSKSGTKERPTPLLQLKEPGGRSPALLGSTLPRVVSMPTLNADGGQRSARGMPSPRGMPASPRTPSSGATSSPARRPSRLASSGGLLRASQRLEQDGFAAGSREPPRSPRASTRMPSKGALRVSTRSVDSDVGGSKEFPEGRTARVASKLSSSRGMARLNSKAQADGSASTTEPTEDLLNTGLLSFEATTPRTPRCPDPQVEAMKEIARLRRELMIPMESMQAAMKLFKQHATVPANGVVFTDGELTKANLASVMRQMSSGTSNDLVETCLVDNAFEIADKDENGSISFYEFAIWYSSHSFDEMFNLDSKEIELRTLSAQLGMPMSEIDTYRKHFDSFDIDGNGTMDRTEFYEMLLKCLKVPKHIGIPKNRVEQMWSDADADGSGVIEFIEFVLFYAKYFGAKGMDGYYAKNGLVDTLRGR